jgi:hypothetical protein
MESDTSVEFVQDDRIYGIDITKTIDKPAIYKIISVRIETYGDLTNGYLVRHTAVVIPENETSIKDFGECWVLQNIIDGKTNTFAVKV